MCSPSKLPSAIAAPRNGTSSPASAWITRKGSSRVGAAGHPGARVGAHDLLAADLAPAIERDELPLGNDLGDLGVHRDLVADAHRSAIGKVQGAEDRAWPGQLRAH